MSEVAPSPSPEESPTDLREDAYLLVTVDQERTKIRSLWEALRSPGLVNKVAGVVSAYMHHRLGRTLSRYSLQNGRVYAGGISYMAIFSLAAAVTLAWSLFSYFFGSNTEFQTLVVETINQYIPGLLSNPNTDSTGIIDPSAVVTTSGTFLTGAIALIVALWAAMKIVSYAVIGLRAMFGLLEFPGDTIQKYFRYFVGLLLLFVAVLSTVLLSLASQTFEAWVATVWPESRRAFDTAAFELFRLTLPSLMDIGMFAVMVRYVARVRVPRRTLFFGSVFFAAASLVLRVSGTAVMSVSHDPVLATIATGATLLVWVNILARASLYICAWMADPPAVPFKVSADQVMATSNPNYVTLRDPATLDWPHNPLNGDVIPAQRIDSNPAQESGEVVEALENHLL